MRVRNAAGDGDGREDPKPQARVDLPGGVDLCAPYVRVTSTVRISVKSRASGRYVDTPLCPSKDQDPFTRLLSTATSASRVSFGHSDEYRSAMVDSIHRGGFRSTRSARPARR